MGKEDFHNDEQDGVDDISKDPEVFATATTERKNKVSRRDMLKIAASTAIASAVASCDIDSEVLTQPTVAKLPTDAPKPTATKVPTKPPEPTATKMPTNTAKPTRTQKPTDVPDGPPVVEIAIGFADLYAGPSTKHEKVVTNLPKGTQLVVLAKDEENAKWYEVETQDGKKAWVQERQVTVVQGFETRMSSVPVSHDIPPLPTAKPKPNPVNPPQPSHYWYPN